jgi:replicative DNA helicase
VSDVQGIILHNVLNDPSSSIEIWPKLKVYFFNSDYSQIYLAISKYYNKYNKLPSFEELKITTREETLVHKVRALELLSVSEDIDNEIAVEALTDQYTQDATLEELIVFLDKLPHYDTEEIKLQIAEILQHLEEQTNNSEDIILMNDIFTIDEEEIHNKIPLGLNNEFDARTGGPALTELVMLGGPRGSGKSVVACNVAANQYKHGNVGLFFTIEMRHREIYNRLIAMLADVDVTRFGRMRCTPEELIRVAEVRTNMFVDSEEVYQDYLKHRQYEKFEIELIRSKKLKPDNQFVIIDNQNLSLADIDMNIQKFKTQFGSRLKTVVVDYVNQIDIPDLYAWKTQIWLSKKLKSFARKYEVVMVTPYQTDKSGEARLSKGILDAADIACNLTPHEHYINIESTKTRNIPPFGFNAPITWETLRMLPTDAVITDETIDENEEKAGDVPWT